jgi:uncharacterized protein YcgI (DUF1989 family)
VQTILERVLPPKTGLALEVPMGHVFRVTDLEGKQVVDMAVFSALDPSEKLSLTYSRSRSASGTDELGVGADYLTKDKLMEGDTLLSNLCNPLLFFLTETPEPKGVHDTHNSSCNRAFYESCGFGPRDGCHEILSGVLAPYRIRPGDIPDTMDLFMNWYHDCERAAWIIGEPVSRAGDFLEFRAEMDCLVALSNCPDDVGSECNAYHCTPVKVEVFVPRTEAPRDPGAN